VTPHRRIAASPHRRWLSAIAISPDQQASAAMLAASAAGA
jgi:hypothetical protein